MSFAWKNAPISDADEDSIKIIEILDETPLSAFTLINRKKNNRGRNQGYVKRILD